MYSLNCIINIPLHFSYLFLLEKEELLHYPHNSISGGIGIGISILCDGQAAARRAILQTDKSCLKRRWLNSTWFSGKLTVSEMELIVKKETICSLEWANSSILRAASFQREVNIFMSEWFPLRTCNMPVTWITQYLKTLQYFFNKKMKVSLFQNTLKSPDPSYNMDLDFWDCIGRKAFLIVWCHTADLHIWDTFGVRKPCLIAE